LSQKKHKGFEVYEAHFGLRIGFQLGGR